MAGIADFLKYVQPKKRANPKGSSDSPTFNRSSPETPLAKPPDREHLRSLIDYRLTSTSAEMMESLFSSDPDVSAAVNAYLTVADTEPHWVVRDTAGDVDRAGQEIVEQILVGLFTRFDYTLPSAFALKPSMRSTFEIMRHMVLLRGAIGAELVLDKRMLPSEIRLPDPSTIEWKEKAPGVLIPEQVKSGVRLSLDVPTFFISFFRKSPLTMYSKSFFVSSINTIAARQQVINDLYSIMRKTGYPRMHIEIVEEVLRKNAPAAAKKDEKEMRTWLTARQAELSGVFSSMDPSTTFVHMDSVQPGIINDKNPAAGLNIESIIKVLNDQNQASLKTMGTIIGRGESGVNTASVEARIFSMNAEALNRPVEDVMSKMLTLALRLQGSESRVDFTFAKVELRPDTELEPQKTMRQARLMEQLSIGLITDDEFHIQMFGRIRPDEVPELSGTDFLSQNKSIDPSEISSNTDPLTRSITPEGSKGSASNVTKRGQAK